jgi:methionyl-tRNA synthetase
MNCFNCKSKLTPQEIQEELNSYKKLNLTPTQEEKKFFMCSSCNDEMEYYKNKYSEDFYQDQGA